MNLIPDFFNHYNSPLLSSWGKLVNIPKYELVFQNNTLIRKSKVDKLLIDIYPLKATEQGDMNDIGYEIHFRQIIQLANGEEKKETFKIIKNLKIREIGSCGCSLESTTNNQRIEIEVRETENIILKFVNANEIIFYLEDEKQLENISLIPNFGLGKDFISKSIFDVIKNTAVKRNAHFCSNCHNIDYGFGMMGSDGKGEKCVHCQQKVSKNEKVNNLLFSMEILKELLKYYDEYGTNSFKEKHLLIFELSKFIQKPLDENKSINEIQLHQVKTILQNTNTLIGGRNGEPIFSLQNGKFGYVQGETNSRPTTPFLHSIAVVLTCLMCIHKF